MSCVVFTVHYQHQDTRDAQLPPLAGGLPGAQATIRSVLIIKEGASMRLAGICPRAE